MAYFEGFEAVEAMQAASEAAGWACEYRQIEAGRLEARTTYQPVGNSSLVCETANRRLDISARTPATAITIMVPLLGTSVLINGRRLTDDRIMMLAPDIDLHASSNCDAEIWSIHLDLDHLSEEVGSEFGSRVFDDRADALQLLRLTVRNSLVEGNESVLLHYESVLADLGEKLLTADIPIADAYNHRHRRKALKRAVDYMESHMGGVIRMGEVCAYAGVSLSTLERLFRREFDEVPTEYLKALRLDALRRALKHGDARDKSIADVASQCGFTHMGRLSAAYRDQFGVLPSADLR